MHADCLLLETSVHVPVCLVMLILFSVPQKLPKRNVDFNGDIRVKTPENQVFVTTSQIRF